MLALEGAFGAPVLEAYGMTEASHQMCSNPLPPSARQAGLGRSGHRRAESASWMRKGKHLAPGERGEVVIQGPNVVSEYENNPEANATSFTDGWFRTGDQGFLDADGYLHADRAHQGADQSRRRKNRARGKSTRCCSGIPP